MMKRLLLVLGAALLLAGCGPIFGQMTSMTDGVKDFRVVQGNLDRLAGDQTLLVYGPFAKTAEAFYICRGEDAAKFSGSLEGKGVFRTALYIERDFDHSERTADALRTRTPAELQEELGLDAPPDRILFGTILHRRTFVAPTRGVEMEVGYRLEFFDPDDKTSTVVDVAVKYLAEKTIPEIAGELARRIAAGS
jgi:hypothetical protein